MKRNITKLTIFTLGIILLCGCGVTKNYEKAKSSNTISAYENYLEKYPTSKYANQARQELAVLYEESDWKNADYFNSIPGFQKFILKFPNSKYSYQAKEKLSVLYEERDWNNATRTNTVFGYKEFIYNYPKSNRLTTASQKIADIEELDAWNKTKGLNSVYGYQNFISSYPKSKYALDAKNKIERLKDDNSWQEAKRLGTIDAYKNYLSNSPYGANRTEALEILRELEIIQPEWNKTLRKNTPKAYRSFIELYPNSFFSKQATDKLNQLESTEWNNAKRKDRISAYEEYLSNFPNGIQSDEAKKRIIDIEVEAIFKGTHGTLPPMNKTSSGYSHSTINDIEIYNNTGYTLTVRYSGSESKKIVIKSKTKEKLKLRNGEYRITASVSAANVSNYAGKEKLEGGSYSSEYYIVTEPVWRN